MNNTKLYIGNINFKADNKILVDFFSKYGEIVELMLIPDPKTGKHKGYGFITFSTQEEANKALSADGTELLGRNLKVSIAKNS